MPKNEAHRDYAKAVRPLMPREAFRRRPALIWYFACHCFVVGACVAAAMRLSTWYCLGLGVIAGHSFACIAFFAHELSHGAILRRGPVRSILQIFAWGVNLIPATLWDEVHNRVHHCHTNMACDPDRRWAEVEARVGPWAYTHALYPHSRTIRWNPLVFVQFLGYIVRNIIAALSGGHWGMLPASPSYTLRQRLRIASELLLMLAIQTLVLWLFTWNYWKWVAVILLGQAVASAIVMSYVFTNHFLNPLQDENDPLAASTSVAVPRFVDWLHLHFSYHTEHHVFPAMDSRFTPLLSEKLQELFPDRYHRIPIGEAWRHLWLAKPFVAPAAKMGSEPSG